LDGRRQPGGSDSAHQGRIGAVLRVGHRLATWGQDRFVRFWSLRGEPLGVWIEPDRRFEVTVREAGGRLYLLDPSGLREFVVDRLGESP
jgi:hypothetical protein